MPRPIILTTDDDDELSAAQVVKEVAQKRNTRSDRGLADKRLADVLLQDSDSDVSSSRGRRTSASSTLRQKRQPQSDAGSSKSRKTNEGVERKSKRGQARQVYVEDVDMESEEFITDSDVVPKKSATNAKKAEKEVFKTDYSEDWEDRHWEVCETCRQSDRRKLVYCQGCAVGVHQECLGGRYDRKHHITRIDAGDFVLQCKHCVGQGGQKGGNRSYITGKMGPMCLPLPTIGSSQQQVEQKKETEPTPEEIKARDDELESERQALREKLYDPASVMFRCNNCLRAAMYEDLRDPEDDANFDPAQCLDCNAHRGLSVHLILGWRNLVDDQLDTMEVQRKELPKEYLREYLVKWNDHPYTKVEWVAASWLNGVATAKKKNFDTKRLNPIEKETDVILEDYNTVEVILDVTYKKQKSFEDMDFGDEDEALRAIKHVQSILVKWQQVPYDDISWDDTPVKDTENDILKARWEAFERAYRDWVRGFYVMVEKTHATKAIKISDVPFTILEKKKQPSNLVGGDLMPYQMEGLNWLYYQYYLKHPAILADEMGLGKTIQIISFLSVLFADWAIAPFLIVAPNSTISNWKREFQKWAPDMRVAAFYGEKSAKSIIEDYEIIHKDTSGQPLKVHALITSYNTVESDAALLKRYNWACLVVDEGQRLKNDESLLFKLLSDFKVNHRILLTGTPLQNNTKELFNLLQFLDPKKMNAAALEAHFDIERQESLTELHTMLQPYFLRRTKVQVLKFLPSKNEVIVPVTMSALQRELYKTILSKNAELMRLVVSRTAAGKAVQNYNNTSLGNVLQQIRKILSHPFLYSPDIEERVEDEQQSFINLTNACAKLQLLKVLLPELKTRGHRVLIFCQFIMMLDILEDWLNSSGILHCRIDGSTPTPERQEAIDQFNKEGSPITCFLLSTRAGGVGINLATADTVIIYDADFNPHQDLQAVARAHRIGQKNKVVVFTLVTRNTAEEKILQIGRKKMVLDQLIIENMATKEENVPYQEILSFGAAALFDEEAKNELVYDISTVQNLVDSSYADIAVDVNEEAVQGEKSKDSFGFAKVWAGDALADDHLGESETAQKEASEDLWAKILAERAALAKAEADKKSAEFSKGRKRTIKDYNEANAGKSLEALVRNPKNGDKSLPGSPEPEDLVSDVEEFSEARITDSSSDDDDYSLSEEDILPLLEGQIEKPSEDLTYKDPYRKILGANGLLETLKRDRISNAAAEMDTSIDPADHVDTARQCRLCKRIHLGGQCQLRNIPVEVCTLCKTAHVSGHRGSGGKICPVFSDIVAMRSLLEDLKKSAEPAALVDQAKSYLRGCIGTMQRQGRQSKKKVDSETAVNGNGDKSGEISRSISEAGAATSEAGSTKQDVSIETAQQGDDVMQVDSVSNQTIQASEER